MKIARNTPRPKCHDGARGVFTFNVTIDPPVDEIHHCLPGLLVNENDAIKAANRVRERLTDQDLEKFMASLDFRVIFYYVNDGDVIKMTGQP